MCALYLIILKIGRSILHPKMGLKFKRNLFLVWSSSILFSQISHCSHNIRAVRVEQCEIHQLKVIASRDPASSGCKRPGVSGFESLPLKAQPGTAIGVHGLQFRPSRRSCAHRVLSRKHQCFLVKVFASSFRL